MVDNNNDHQTSLEIDSTITLTVPVERLAFDIVCFLILFGLIVVLLHEILQCCLKSFKKIKNDEFVDSEDEDEEEDEDNGKYAKLVNL